MRQNSFAFDINQIEIAIIGMNVRNNYRLPFAMTTLRFMVLSNWGRAKVLRMILSFLGKFGMSPN